LTHYIIKEQIEGLHSQLKVVEQGFLVSSQVYHPAAKPTDRDIQLLNVLKTRQGMDSIVGHMESVPRAQEPTTYSTIISNSNFGNISNVSNVGYISQNFWC